MARYFRKIKAWQLADKLAVEVYRLTKTFPKDETYGVRSQIRRAAVSVPTNIVEGSLFEVDYLFHLCSQLGYISEDIYEGLKN